MYTFPGGSVGFLLDFEFYKAVLGVPSGPIEFAAPLGFKMLDSQPDSLKAQFRQMFMNFDDFRKVVMASWPAIYRVFGPAVPSSAF